MFWMKRVGVALCLAGVVGCGPKGGDDDTDLPTDDAVDTDVLADTDLPADTDSRDTDASDTDAASADLDNDGFTVAQGDCNDDDDTVNPDAEEIAYDGVDQDCDGESDYDADGDGVDSSSYGGFDCDDTDETIFPGALETYYDGVDQDCDGQSDYDADRDGEDSDDYGGDDCDDADDSVYPGADDPPYDGVDSDCARDDDYDVDGDGYRSADHGGDDCNDANDTVFPGADDDWYDGVDADCAGNSDYDRDGDGSDSDEHGGFDCDDGNVDVSPARLESCNGVDDDCDGAVDESDATDASTYYQDDDRDGFGVGVAFRSCESRPDWSLVNGDCDDNSQTRYPSAPPVACDGLDNDCDPATEEQEGGASIGATQYETLADALAVAAPQDVVRVCEGRHFLSAYEPPGALIIEAAFSGSQVVIDAEDNASVFQIRNVGHVGLRGLTLVGGLGTLDAGKRLGGAIYAIDGMDVTLEDCVVSGNRAGDGAGIWMGADAELALIHTVLADNVGDATLGLVPHGGNLWVGDRSVVVMVDAQLLRGEASACGGVRLGAGAAIVASGATRIADNIATLEGGGVCAADGGGLVGLTIEDNEAATGAGISGQDLTLYDVLVRNNTASLLGGGMALSGACRVQGGQVTGNLAGVGVGGVDVAFPSSVLTLQGVRISGNSSSFFAARAGGVEMHGGTLVSVAADWGTANDNPPADISLTVDARTYDFAGVQSFVCDDGANTGCL